ncbi:MAG TPA: hypothetical protein VFQ61_36975 [Polyangiaceae bacterium]|nr:hypothetical protein [Polyangiaceae bacterium]
MLLVRLRASGPMRVAWLSLIASTHLACGDEGRPSALLGDVTPGFQSGRCSRPEAGCACSATEPVACSYMESRDAQSAICAEGQRTCSAGVWGECVAQRRVKKYAPPAPADQQGQDEPSSPSGLRLSALASSAARCGDPCQPDCWVFKDSSTGLAPPAGLVGNGTGITLPSRAAANTCSDLRVEASADTITVKSFEPLATEPAFVSFTARCGPGGEQIFPTWAVDGAPHNATIDQNGTLTVLAPIAGNVEVRAINRQTSSARTLTIRVDVEEIDPDCADIAEDFTTRASALIDPGKTLYPYSVPARPVVFPLGLAAPLVQWANGGVASSCVRVGLRFPSGAAAPDFSYAKYVSGEPRQGLVAGNEQPALQIPSAAWSVFDRTAKGADAEIFVQRRSDEASPRVFDEMSIPLRFADEPLRASLYYTQYLRRFRSDSGASTPICSGSRQTEISPASYPRTLAESGCLSADCEPNVGPVCPAGNCTQAKNVAGAASLQRLDLRSAGSAPEEPFGSSATCTACHSLSANGKLLAAANRKYAGGATLTNVGDELFEPYAAPPTYSYRSSDDEDTSPESEQSRGFSLGALSPDGRYVLQAPNFWGTTESHVTLAQGTNLRDAGYSAGGKRAFLLDVRKLRAPVNYATIAPLPDHVRTKTQLIGDEEIPLAVDGSYVVVGDSVLIKDSTDATENGVYTVARSGGVGSTWLLERRSDSDQSGDLVFGQKFHVEAGTTLRNRTFYVAVPSTGVIDPGATPLRFALYTTATAATTTILPPYTINGFDLTGSGPLPASYIDDVEPAVGLSVLVKDEEGQNSRNNGIFRFTSLDPWVLTRRSDTNSSVEFQDLLRVRVNQGTRNGGRAFTLRAPGPVELTEDGLIFDEETNLNEGLVFGGRTLPNLMYPTFSPNGQHLAYVSGAADGLDTGWRRGLNILDFDPSTPAFSNRRLILNRFTAGMAGNVLKWPAFEPDSHSLLFVESSPDEFCPLEASQGRCSSITRSASGHEVCTASTETLHVDTDLERACYQEPSTLGYGSASPMARGYWPGRLHSIDVETGAASDRALDFLNRGQLAADADKVYQPSVLPVASGGYRWVVFSSHRSYGNQFNQVGTHFSCGSSTLWIAALDDREADAGDRSYPAFLVPGQRLSGIEDPDENRHYLNERGVLVPAACLSEGSECTSDVDCCGGSGANPTSACRPDYPESEPVSHCRALSEACRVPGESCGADRACCAGLVCQAGACLSAQFYDRGVFEREFVGECPVGYKPRWLDFEWHASATADSKILFTARVSADGDFSDASSVTLAQADSENQNPPPAGVQRVSVGDALWQSDIASGSHLKVRMEFVPSSDGRAAPTLFDWAQRYDCVALE